MLNDQVPAKVPGGIYSDLSSAGVLTGPLYYRFNDREFLWAAKDNWTFAASLDLNLTDLVAKSTVKLECEGREIFSFLK
jgi:hypothetical protein